MVNKDQARDLEANCNDIWQVHDDVPHYPVLGYYCIYITRRNRSTGIVGNEQEFEDAKRIASPEVLDQICYYESRGIPPVHRHRAERKNEQKNG